MTEFEPVLFSLTRLSPTRNKRKKGRRRRAFEQLNSKSIFALNSKPYRNQHLNKVEGRVSRCSHVYRTSIVDFSESPARSLFGETTSKRRHIMCDRRFCGQKTVKNTAMPGIEYQKRLHQGDTAEYNHDPTVTHLGIIV